MDADNFSFAAVFLLLRKLILDDSHPTRRDGGYYSRWLPNYNHLIGFFYSNTGNGEKRDMEGFSGQLWLSDSSSCVYADVIILLGLWFLCGDAPRCGAGLGRRM